MGMHVYHITVMLRIILLLFPLVCKENLVVVKSIESSAQDRS